MKGFVCLKLFDVEAFLALFIFGPFLFSTGNLFTYLFFISFIVIVDENTHNPDLLVM